ncbi:E3 ubiquitin-protein ligase RNF169 [Corvus moneduloides]|uniref:RING-type E3 ubiquitin transferase n=3 Tax=Corvidae TaxID=28725 RepID=A0A8C3DLJ7_CORMO|nr:E3 ubiquitin-protein ligase RNF169 [Corvus moneduloides]
MRGRRGRRGPSKCGKMAAAAAGAGGRAAVRGRRRRGRSAAEEEQDAVVLSVAECPVCRQALVEAVTPPCRHSLCLACFQRCLQGPGLCCPLCRSRLSTRARRQQAEPAATTAAGAAGGEQRPPDQDFIFRAPIKLSKTGELREEYESQLRKLREEKLQEEKTSEDLINKFILDDMDVGKRKMEEQQKKDESVVLKGNQECFPERLSDSENEEPFQGKQTHRSAFVSKTSAYSFAFLSGNLTTKVERSRSCNDTIQERSKSRQRSAPATKTKVLPITGASTPLLGVLSSTQNNRCLSAPDLTAEKRLVLNAVSSLSALHRPERSISPESNDSISEELNHFKPIVCSPCTPPKRLPDGRVLSPLIIKSTPRNLNRSLQKPTTYEASPRILKKWEQIFQERQIKKTLSKATLTSLASEPGEDTVVPDITNSSSCTKEQPQVQDDHLPPDTTGEPRAELDFFPSVSEMKLGRGSEKSRGSQALTTDDGADEPDVRSNVTALNTRVSEVPDLKVNTFMDKSCLSLGPKMLSRRLMGVSASLPDTSALGVPIKPLGKKQLKYLNNSELINVQNSTCNSVENIIGEQPPLLRRGRKRRCKTKHLEHNGSVKRLRHVAGEVGLPPEVRDVEQKLQQEEEDRRLALHLQRIFDSENRTVDRRKVRVDRYLLRSKSTLGAK